MSFLDELYEALKEPKRGDLLDMSYKNRVNKVLVRRIALEATLAELEYLRKMPARIEAVYERHPVWSDLMEEVGAIVREYKTTRV